ncbi:hypothetical protein SAMN04488544_1152 [Microlunatus sagamiharensis]|uniref:ANTAR domain-containing protein n=1 Tax=Microlunatus sagamiharensis TaxID=546874 RepID=A0A1H2LZU8_9ACTN|nr:hypothetical protein [Microlunatus sagamiharensis]SDU86449.1 hypothetical protein SAMN04488544_1152 [Microlunatus sagamiharensis]
MAEPGPGPAPGLARALVADLHDLAVDLAVGGYTRTALAMLERDLHRCAPSALGATITLDRGPHHAAVQAHVVPRVLQPAEVRSALRIPLPMSDDAVEASITLYAAAECAFADLAHALGVTPDLATALPDRPIEPGIQGLTDLTTVNIALGHLLNRGRTLSQAREELAHLAQHRHTDLARAARLLLDSS